MIAAVGDVTGLVRNAAEAVLVLLVLLLGTTATTTVTIAVVVVVGRCGWPIELRPDPQEEPFPRPVRFPYRLDLFVAVQFGDDALDDVGTHRTAAVEEVFHDPFPVGTVQEAVQRAGEEPAVLPGHAGTVLAAQSQFAEGSILALPLKVLDREGTQRHLGHGQKQRIRYITANVRTDQFTVPREQQQLVPG